MSITLLNNDDKYLTIDDSGDKILRKPDMSGTTGGDDYVITVDIGGEGAVVEEDGDTWYVHFLTSEEV